MRKQLNNTKKFVTSVVTKKEWTVDTNTNSDIYVNDSILPVLKGKKMLGNFYPSSSIYYDPKINELNWDGSYKSLIYNREFSMFYKNKGNPTLNFGVYNYSNEVRDIGNEITSIHIPKNRYGERIIPNSVYILDNSNPYVEINIIDDGKSNLILSPTSIIDSVNTITGSISEGDIEYVNSVKYSDSNGNIITKEESIELYKNGQEVYVVSSSEANAFNRQNRDYYNPTFERFGKSIGSSGEYVAVSSIMDDASFATMKNGAVCLYKKASDSIRQIKTFNSPFSQHALSIDHANTDPNYSNGIHDDTYGDNMITTEYGDFILYLETGDLSTLYAKSGSKSDNYGYSIAIDGKNCAIASTGYSKCGTIPETGSGLVFCYMSDKGGQDNWGIINVLEGESPQDNFGCSVSISGDLLVIGAPGYNNTGSVYVYRLKRYMSDACDSIPTSSVWTSSSLADFSSSLLYGTGSSGLFELNGSAIKQNFWQPMRSICFSQLSSDIYGPIITEQDNIRLEAALYGDRFNAGLEFSHHSQVPQYIVGEYTWKLEVMLVGPHGNSGFGGCVDVNNGRILVGNNVLSTSSSAWLYTSTKIYADNCPVYEWNLTSTMVRTDGDVYENLPSELGNKNTLSGFGNSVSIYGDYMCVGCPYDLVNSTRTLGTATIYKYANGTNECGSSSLSLRPTQKLIPHLSEFGLYNFGYSCKIDNNLLVIGSPKALDDSYNIVNVTGSKFSINKFLDIDSKYTKMGKANVYKLDTITEQFNSLIELSTRKELNNVYHRYGESVSINNNSIIIGNPVYSTGSFDISYYDSMSMSSSWLNDDGKKLIGEIYQYNLTSTDTKYVGNVFYNTGTIIITNTSSIYQNVLTGTGNNGFILTYNGQHTIQETEYMISIDAGEFNVSTNPTSITGRSPIIDVNSDNVIDFNDINIILQYINGNSPVENTNTSDSLLENENNKSWWKNDLLITESEDAIIANSLIINLNSDKSTLTSERYNKITNNLINTNILDINGDGIVDIKDGKLLWNFWLGKLNVDIVESCVDINCTRTYLNDILEYLKVITGRVPPYPTKKQSIILSPSSSIYAENNGGLIDEYFKNYSVSSSIDPTGSYLSTYVTGVGLYCGNDLVLVGKLGSPIKNVIDYPMNFSIKFDAF